MGNISDFNPPAQITGDNFATIGEDVRSSWPRTLFENGTGYTMLNSGTSVSTVITAAMAAMVLDYAWQTLPLENDGIRMGLQSSQGMRALLRLLGRRVGDFTYLCPWSFFTGGREQEHVKSIMLDELMKV